MPRPSTQDSPAGPVRGRMVDRGKPERRRRRAAGVARDPDEITTWFAAKIADYRRMGVIARMTAAEPLLHPADVRRANFPDVMDFYAPGLKRWQTSEWVPANPRRFLSVSVTGSACALSCDHCQAKVLDGMVSVQAGQDLFSLAARFREQGSEGLLHRSEVCLLPTDPPPPYPAPAIPASGLEDWGTTPFPPPPIIDDPPFPLDPIIENACPTAKNPPPPPSPLALIDPPVATPPEPPFSNA